MDSSKFRTWQDLLDEIEGLKRELCVERDNSLHEKISFSKILRLRDERIRELEESLAELRLEAETDELTELINRRKFKKEIEKVINLQVREGHEVLSIAFLDIDHFKRFNTIYGHLVGDLVLKIVALTMKNFFQRGQDIVARWGGEEFVIYFTDRNPEVTILYLEKLRAVIENLVIMDDNPTVRVTVSIGLATKTIQSGDTTILDKLLFEAGKAMSQAKESGRNRVCVYEEVAQLQ